MHATRECNASATARYELAMSEEEYVMVSKKIYRAMITPYDEAVAEENARHEWHEDTRGEARLPVERFKDAIFELADLVRASRDQLSARYRQSGADVCGRASAPRA